MNGLNNNNNNNVWDGGAFISLRAYISAMTVYFAVRNDGGRLSICKRTDDTQHNNTAGWMAASWKLSM